MNDVQLQIDRLIEVGRYAEARQRVFDALLTQPEDLELQISAARLETLDGDLDKAREHLKEVLCQSPSHFSARYLLYHIEVDSGRAAEAEQILVGLIRDYPEEADLFATYADLMLETLHLDKARNLVDEALRLDPECRSARISDVTLSAVEGQQQRADLQLADLIAEDPDAQDVILSLIQTLIDQSRPDEALRLSQELLRVQPDNVALVDLIVLLRAQGHVLGWPLRPLFRFGWAASGALWLGAVLAINFMRRTEATWALPFAGAYLLFVIYSWAYIPIMTRWLRWRGI